MEAIRGLRSRSDSVRTRSGRTRLRRVKRTSLGVCKRDEVRVNMFSGEKKGRVEMRAKRAEIKRMFRPRNEEVGVDRIGSGEVLTATL